MWKQIKSEYIAGGTSYRKLAAKYGVSFSTLKEIARREKWTDLREQVQNKADTKFVDMVGEKQAVRSAKIIDVADKLLDKISETIDACEVIDSQSLKHFTSALKDIKDIKGIKSDIDLREQEARIAKLRKDAEDGGRDDDKPSGIVLLPSVPDKLTPPSEEEDDE